MAEVVVAWPSAVVGGVKYGDGGGVKYGIDGDDLGGGDVLL